MADNHTNPYDREPTPSEELNKAKENVKGAAYEAAQEAKTRASEYAREARDQAHDRANSAKDYAAGEAGKVASALRRASDDLAEGSVQERAFGAMARTIADAADDMRHKDVVEIGDDLNHFARRNPAAFIGSAALLGFAAARFLKSSSRRSRGSSSGSGYGSGYGGSSYEPDTAYRPDATGRPATAAPYPGTAGETTTATSPYPATGPRHG